MSQGTSRRNRDNYWEEVKGTDPGYRSRSVRSCVLALKSILEVIGEIDVKKLNKVVLEENETRCSDLEDELGNLESLLLIEDQKEDESEDESEAGDRIIVGHELTSKRLVKICSALNEVGN
ncbi:18755_t:CDS:2 [Entrophospora sp. SA101]|nr:18755_t:CDS:2 [Entrophospora sp. SA101]